MEECIDTICHEVRHSLQFQIVSSIDWDNPVFQTAYFDELRSWLRNQGNYKSAWLYGLEEYESQPLEVDAREYAESETEKIMSYVMRQICMLKMLQHTYIRDKLKESGEIPLAEFSKSDFYWGIGEDGNGENMLGRIWESIRKEIE